MTGQIVWVIIRHEGYYSEAWRVYDNEASARLWAETVSDKSVNTTYEISMITVLTNAFA